MLILAFVVARADYATFAAGSYAVLFLSTNMEGDSTPNRLACWWGRLGSNQLGTSRPRGYSPVPYLQGVSPIVLWQGWDRTTDHLINPPELPPVQGGLKRLLKQWMNYTIGHHFRHWEFH